MQFKFSKGDKDSRFADGAKPKRTNYLTNTPSGMAFYNLPARKISFKIPFYKNCFFMKIGTTRMEAFSDGVIAIIITIMILELKLPDTNVDTTHEVINHMRHLLPYFGAYAFSFMMIGIFWTNHHHMFHLLEKTDERLLWQNLVFLFWLSLIPLATATIGANPLLSTAAALYGFIMLMNAVSFAYMRSYTIRKGLVHRDEDKALNWKINFVTLKAKSKSFAGVIIYLASIPLAFISVYLAYICFIIPPIIFFTPVGVDDEKLANKIEEKNS